MAANSYFFGLTADKQLVGGNTALITTERQKEELFGWFKARNCIVGFFATHWECGFTQETHRTWFGDRTYESELHHKLAERYPADVEQEG